MSAFPVAAVAFREAKVASVSLPVAPYAMWQAIRHGQRGQNLQQPSLYGKGHCKGHHGQPLHQPRPVTDIYPGHVKVGPVRLPYEGAGLTWEQRYI